MARSQFLKNISDVDYFSQLSLGNVDDSIRWSKFGRTGNASSTESIIAHNGVYGLPDIADTVVVTSDDVADVPLGAGARKVKIWGLADDWSLQDEEIELGATSVKLWRRVFTARVTEAGTVTAIGGANQGLISIVQTSGTAMLAILKNEGSSLCACFTVPLGKTVLIWDATTTTGKGKDTINRLKFRDNNNGAPFTTEGIRDNYQNQVGRTFVSPSPIGEKFDIIFTATSSLPNTGVSASFIMEIIDT